MSPTFSSDCGVHTTSKNYVCLPIYGCHCNGRHRSRSTVTKHKREGEGRLRKEECDDKLVIPMAPEYVSVPCLAESSSDDISTQDDVVMPTGEYHDGLASISEASIAQFSIPETLCFAVNSNNGSVFDAHAVSPHEPVGDFGMDSIEAEGDCDLSIPNRSAQTHSSIVNDRTEEVSVEVVAFDRSWNHWFAVRLSNRRAFNHQGKHSIFFHERC